MEVLKESIHSTWFAEGIFLKHLKSVAGNRFKTKKLKIVHQSEVPLTRASDDIAQIVKSKIEVNKIIIERIVGIVLENLDKVNVTQAISMMAIDYVNPYIYLWFELIEESYYLESTISDIIKSVNEDFNQSDFIIKTIVVPISLEHGIPNGYVKLR